MAKMAEKSTVSYPEEFLLVNAMKVEGAKTCKWC